MPFLISSYQMAHVKNGFISVSGKLISDIIEIANTIAPEGFLATVDIEKSFDSVITVFYCNLFENSDSVSVT